MALFFSSYGISFAKIGYIQNSEMSGINMASIYVAFPLTGFTWLLFVGEKIAEDIRMMKGVKKEPKQ